MNPIIKNKGSAIFIHVAKNYYKKTKGCIALKKKDLIELISLIKKNTKIKIS
jgi:L,D-peptidoglycan transpeptidase YkuD (ErfK/YbiS/YcfS/YnhG family)